MYIFLLLFKFFPNIPHNLSLTNTKTYYTISIDPAITIRSNLFLHGLPNLCQFDCTYKIDERCHTKYNRRMNRFVT